MSDRVVVIKFGGSALNPKSLKGIPGLVSEYLAKWRVVLVVSALSRPPYPYATDSLLKLIYSNYPQPLSPSQNGIPKVIKDFVLSTGEMIASGLVAAVLHGHGIPSEPLTGFQAGILLTDSGKIKSVNPIRVIQALNEGKVPVICGFQGMTERGNIVTLPRGGSDITAVAIAQALNAEHVILVKDVDGVLSADPKVVDSPLLHKFVSYEELGELTYNGSKVVHPDAVALSQKLNIPLYIRSMDRGGTWVGSKSPSSLITAITRKPNITWFKVSLREPKQVEMLLQELANHSISLDFISMYQRMNRNSIVLSYTVSRDQMEKAKTLLREIHIPFTYLPEMAKVSVIGAGIRGKPGVFHRIYKAFQRGNILPIQVSDSHISISFLFSEKDSEKAVRELHNEFFEEERLNERE